MAKRTRKPKKSKRTRKPKKSKADRLQDLYDSLPTIECKGKCFGACGPIPATRLELKLLNKAKLLPVHDDDIIDVSPRRIVLARKIKFKGDLGCPVLAGNRCSAHAGRPMICRLYGMVSDPKMICDHGCEPTRWLSSAEAYKIFNEIERLK